MLRWVAGNRAHQALAFAGETFVGELYVANRLWRARFRGDAVGTVLVGAHVSDEHARQAFGGLWLARAMEAAARGETA